MHVAPSSRLVTSVALGALALAAAVSARSAHAQPAAPPADEAQTRVDAAMALYAAADLAGALDELTKAHAIAPRPDILFGIARIHMERGDCVNAMRAYRTYLESRPGPSSTQVATDAIQSCQKILSAMGDQPIATEPDTGARDRTATAATEPPAAATPPRRERVNRGWYRDRIGGALVAGATVGFAGGGVLWLSARTDVSRANRRGADGVTLDEARDLEASADRKQRWAMIAGGVGGALLVGGVLRYTLADHTDTLEVTPPPSGHGATVTVGWHF
ncbi:MAG TPA: hypothetical protein VM261_26240 [Kofleriaceae bacterium]|nr:hypothetical protein [Kofleriaceae bacterium]